MAFIGESASFDFLIVGFEGLGHFLTEVRESFDEFRCAIAEQAEHVLLDEDLAVTAGTATDADGWDSQIFRDEGSESGRDAFQYE